MKKYIIIILLAITALASCKKKVGDGEYTINLYSTNDIHGRYFDSLYVGNNTKESLLAISEYMKDVREEFGKDNVILLDAGDFLQGDNAAYYFNYVDTQTKHIYARMAEYIGYDATTVGNHDIETGHAVYDRIRKTMKVPFLAANAIRNDNGKPYFQDYVILHKGGLKVAVIGFTNPDIKSWLAPEIWDGMTFENLLTCVQGKVDQVIAKEKPQVVIVSTHSGTGNGDGSSLESQGLELLSSLKNVDILLCSHDHRATTKKNGEMTLINAGSHCRTLGHGTVTVTIQDGKVVSKTTTGEIIPIDKTKVDEQMRAKFRADYEAVRAFTVQEVGKLENPLVTRESLIGMCDYMNLIHTVSLSCEPAQLSFAAPLTYNGKVNEGTLVYNDLFTIYPYENQLFVVKMTGLQIKNFLEYSYDHWINTVTSSDDLLLKLRDQSDPRTGQIGWSFIGRSYNFDSMAGAFYTVDVTKPYGERIEISKLADGTPFSLEGEYNVAMTSYRASGGGDTMGEGAGIDTDNIDAIVVKRYPEIREVLYEYFKNHKDESGTIMPVTSAELAAPDVVGEWHFVPEDIVGPAIERDFERLFPASR